MKIKESTVNEIFFGFVIGLVISYFTIHAIKAYVDFLISMGF